jgi:hypothetical protein
MLAYQYLALNLVKMLLLWRIDSQTPGTDHVQPKTSVKD